MLESPEITRDSAYNKRYANNAIKDQLFLSEVYKIKRTSRVELYIQASEKSNISNVHLYSHMIDVRLCYTVTYSLKVTVRQFVVMSVITIFPRKGWKEGNVSSFLFSALQTVDEWPFTSSAGF